MAFKFESLKVWQKAVELVDEINIVSRTFPKEEIYSLTAQVRRAATSVVLNIAEGSTGQSNPEFKRFINIALRSNIEVVACIILAKRHGYIKEALFKKIYSFCEELFAMLNALKNYLDTTR